MRYVARFPLEYPKIIIGVSLTMMCLALIFIPNLHISTDRNLLSGKDNAEFKRREEVNDMFGTSLVAVIIFAGETSKQVHAAADDLSKELMKHPEHVKMVFHRADVKFFERHALMFASVSTVEKISELITGDAVDLDAFGKMDGLAPMINVGVARLENQVVPEGASQAVVGKGLEFFGDVLKSIENWFKGPQKNTLGIVERLWQSGPSMHGGADGEGYLADNDGREPKLVIMFVQPASGSQEMDVVAPFTDMLRDQASKVASKYPGLETLITGMPPLQADELRLISRDCLVAGFVAGIGVLLVFMIAFRSFVISVFLVLPLGVGLIWAAGFTGAVYGHLTMITSYFAAVLFGLGVPFTIHIVSRFHEALLEGKDKRQALEIALTRAGPGVVVGGITTTVAFMAIALSDFQGFAEMGIISGVGVFLILLANLTLLPAVMLLWHPGVDAVPARKHSGAFWVKLAGSRFVIPVLSGMLLIAGFIVANRVGFDYAVENMLPADAEAVKGIRVLNDRTDFTSTYSVAVASSIDDAKLLRQKFMQLPTVERAEAISLFVPPNQHAKIAALSKINADKKLKLAILAHHFNERVRRVGACTANQLADSILELSDVLEDLSFDAKRAGRTEAGKLAKLSRYAKSVSETIRDGGDDERAQKLERQVFELVARGLNVLASGLDDKGFTVDELPAAVKGRYVSKDGKNFAVLIFPTGDIGQRDFLYRHVDEILSVDSNATGHPVTHRKFTDMVHRGFLEAALLSGVAVLILVLLDLRSFKGVILGIAPLLFAAGWTAILMFATGFKFNYANLMALPILIGTGVDYGVHMAHRAKQEGSVTCALKTTGRAIALSGLTTLIGFGSLIFGNHWGVRSLGLVLVMGIFSSLVAALIVLPSILADKRASTVAQ